MMNSLVLECNYFFLENYYRLILIFNLHLYVIDDIPEERVANVHQDDDGFESLNGNVSSDNDKVISRGMVPRNRLRKEELVCHTNDRRLWLENNIGPQISPSSKQSGLIHKYTLLK